MGQGLCELSPWERLVGALVHRLSLCGFPARRRCGRAKEPQSQGSSCAVFLSTQGAVRLVACRPHLGGGALQGMQGVSLSLGACPRQVVEAAIFAALGSRVAARSGCKVPSLGSYLLADIGSPEWWLSGGVATSASWATFGERPLWAPREHAQQPDVQRRGTADAGHCGGASFFRLLFSLAADRSAEMSTLPSQRAGSGSAGLRRRHHPASGG